jgi:DNA primase catalytic core
MGPIPEEFLDSVRSGVDIVELISEYVPLKRSGQNYMGLCPFHREKTPSFSVSPAKQIFYCFGCGAGGNVFSFLMKMENIPFLEAVEILADRLGLDVPRSPRSREKHERKERFYELNAHAAEYYHRILVHGAEGESARGYLMGRGVNRSSWGKFLLGFAPNASGGLLKYLKGKGFSLQEIRQSGQFNERYGTLQERFRGRIIFPICDARGRCLGFGGRALGDEEPKYLNSPESPVFNKSRNLYGLHLAIPAVRDQKKIIVVEGYLDCITAQEYGFRNTVAALGTAFTRDQSRLLLRYTKDVVLAFDEDAAGSAATMRGAGFLQELGAQVSILNLPEAKDPDEFLRAHGKEAFASALENRTTGYFEFRLEKADTVTWIGILISFAGVTLVVVGSEQTIGAGADALWGNLLIVVAAIFWGMYTILLRVHFKDVSITKVTAYAMLFTTLPLIILFPGKILEANWALYSLEAWGGVLYSGIFVLGISNIIWNAGVQKVGPTKTSIYANLPPFISVLVGWVLLSESITMIQVLGGVLIIAGLAYAGKSN